MPLKEKSGEPVAHLGHREADGLGVAGGGDALDHRPARISEPEELGDLVERLPGGVVSSLADALVATAVARQVERGVAPGNHQGKKWIFRGPLLEEGGVDVTLEVVDADQRLLLGVRHGLGRRASDEERADEAWALGHRDAVHVAEGHPGVVQGAPDHRHDHLGVPAGRQLRHDTAVGRVDVVLRRHDAREDLAAPVQYGGRGLVARRLDPEHDHRLGPSLVPSMVSAPSGARELIARPRTPARAGIPGPPNAGCARGAGWRCAAGRWR